MSVRIKNVTAFLFLFFYCVFSDNLLCSRRVTERFSSLISSFWGEKLNRLVYWFIGQKLAKD